MYTNKYYRVDAVLLGVGTHCEVWVEKGSGIDAGAAQAVAYTFDQEIYNTMIDVFGFNKIKVDGEDTIINTLQAAGLLLGNKDSKLCILLLDIKDSFREPYNKSFVAGYFWYGNFFSRNSGPGFLHSNERNMIYIDINPGKIGPDLYATIAHETQHLMNFVTSCYYRDHLNTIYALDTWIDEGLSAAAEREYSNEHTQNRVKWFNNEYDFSGLIQQGNNFFVWDNHKENQYALLDDYATVYLFFQWLRVQAAPDIFSDIITSPYPYYNYRAVTNAAKEYGIISDDKDWETLLKTWLAANYVNSSSGKYGYKEEKESLGLRVQTVTAGTTNIFLYPGEGVYSSPKSGFQFPDQGANIKYARLNRAAPYLNDGGPLAGSDVLLTFNANDSNRGAPESGKTTGASSEGIHVSGASLPARFSGPFPISAGEMLRKNGFDRMDSSKIPKLPMGTLSRE